MPANSRKDISLKHNREKGKNTLKRWTKDNDGNCDGYLERNNKRRSDLNQEDWVVMGKGSISLGLPFLVLKTAFCTQFPPNVYSLSKKSCSSNLSLYKKILKNGSKFRFPSFQINFYPYFMN